MSVIRAAVITALYLVVPAAAVELVELEGSLRGYPAMRDTTGKKLADGDFAQWIENNRLHVQIVYEFGSGRRVEEKAVFRQRPELIQDEWSLEEARDGRPYRRFAVDFNSSTATAQKREENELKRWSEKIDVEAGRTFAGFGFTLAIKQLRKRLIGGERIELKAVGFMPKPRLASVEISHGGVDRIRMSGRVVGGDRFVIHPKIPWIAEFFVDVPDMHIWLTNPPPAGFLRWEGPLAEPGDPVVRVDLLPGDGSGPATPVGTAGRK
jgi:hypothetical protein